jgi:hypothetical protein
MDVMALEHSANMQTRPTDTEANLCVETHNVNNIPVGPAPLQRQEVHPSKNIHHGLYLWERVREYDARSAVEAAADASAGFMPVLTRNQKQKLKVQHVLSKKSSKSNARGSTDQ